MRASRVFQPQLGAQIEHLLVSGSTICLWGVHSAGTDLYLSDDLHSLTHRHFPFQISSLLIDGNEWIAGGKGALHHSTDQGHHWEFLPLETDEEIVSVLRSEGGLWVGGANGFLACQRDPKPKWKVVRRRSAPGPVRLRDVRGVHALSHGLWRIQEGQARPEFAARAALVDLINTKHRLMVCTAEGTIIREDLVGWETIPSETEDNTCVGLVAIDQGVLQVWARGDRALRFSIDHGDSFQSLQLGTLFETVPKFLEAKPDGFGGAFVLAEEGHLLRVTTTGPTDWHRPIAKASTLVMPARLASRVPWQTADEKSLTAAVLANPDDDAPRMVFADWSSSYDDPRGEFIVLQCTLGGALSRSQRWGVRAPEPSLYRGADLIELEERAIALLRKHGAVWLALVRTSGHDWWWHRGFIEHVFAGTEFFEGAAELLSSHPVKHLTLEHVSPDAIESLAHTPLRTIRHLNLWHQHRSAELVEALCSPNMSQIESLNLSCTPIGDLGAKRLFAESSLKRVKAFNLANCQLTDSSLVALADSNFEHLESIDLEHNQLSEGLVKKLLKSSSLPRLAEVKLGTQVYSRPSLGVNMEPSSG